MNQTRRTARERARRSPWRIALIVLLAIAVAGAATVGVYLYTLASAFDSAQTVATPFPKDSHRPPKPPPSPDPVAQNILLLGTDTRGNIGDSLESAAGSRSDTIMVVHIPAHRQSIQVMSIMRDNWVGIPGYGEAKINAALALGGVPLTVQVIEGMLGVRMDHVAIIDFEGLAGVTDALGGVTVQNPQEFTPRHGNGETFPAGDITLDGRQALAFVRERYSFVDGDYTRVRNQQAFIKAVLAKTLSAETLTNPLRISSLVAAVAPYLARDEGLHAGYAATLAIELRDVRADDVMFFTMPTLGTGRVGTQSVVHPDWDAIAVVSQHFIDDTLDTYEPRFEGIP